MQGDLEGQPGTGSAPACSGRFKFGGTIPKPRGPSGRIRKHGKAPAVVRHANQVPGFVLGEDGCKVLAKLGKLACLTVDCTERASESLSVQAAQAPVWRVGH